MSGWVRVCAVSEMLPGESKVAWDGDTPILVFNYDGDFYALEDRCSHEDFELSAGAFDGEEATIECVLHGSKFDVTRRPRAQRARLCAGAQVPGKGRGRRSVDARRSRLRSDLLQMRIVIINISGEATLVAPTPEFHVHEILRTGAAGGGAACRNRLPHPCGSTRAADAQTLDRVEVVGKLDKHATSAITATRTGTALKDVPQSVSAVTTEELQERNARSVNEALETVPGVSMTMGEGRRDQVNIRGFSALFDQYLDGFRDDSPYYRDLGNVERIEVLRGPASVLYGRGSGGGLVNRVSKKPRFGGDIGEVSLAAGSDGFVRGTFDIGRSNGEDFAWRFNAASERADSFRDHLFAAAADAGAVGGLAHRQRHADGAGGIAEGPPHARSRHPGINGRPADVDISTYYGDRARDHLDNDAAQARVGWLAPLGERWQLRVAAVGTRVDGTFYNTYVVKPSADGTMVERAQYNADTHSRDRFGQAELLGDIDGGGIAHTLLLGIEGGHQQRDTRQWRGTAGNVTLVDPDPGIGSMPGALSTDRAFVGNSVGVYAQDQMAVGEHWKALVGARWDRYEQDLEDHLGTDPLSRTDNKLSPRAGLVCNQPSTIASTAPGADRSSRPAMDSPWRPIPPTSNQNSRR
jgi:catecholate siderophore receptor